MGLKITGRLIGLMAAGAIVLAACGGGATEAPASGEPPSTGDIKLGVAFPNSDTFLSRVQDGMKAKAEELGVEITITDAKDDTQTQLSQVENVPRLPSYASSLVNACTITSCITSSASWPSPRRA